MYSIRIIIPNHQRDSVASKRLKGKHAFNPRSNNTPPLSSKERREVGPSRSLTSTGIPLSQKLGLYIFGSFGCQPPKSSQGCLLFLRCKFSAKGGEDRPLGWRGCSTGWLTRFKHIAMFSKHNYHGISNASNRNDPKAINGYHKGLEDHLEVKMISQPRQNRRFC